MNTFFFAGDWISDAVTERLGWMLVHSLWQFALIAAVGWGLMRLLRRWSASARYNVLLCGLVAMIAAPAATYALLDIRPAAEPTVDIMSLTVDSAVVAFDERQPEQTAALAVPVAPAAESQLPPPAPLTSPALFNTQADGYTWFSLPQLLRPWFGELVTLWCLGVLLLSLRPLISWLTIRRLRTKGVSEVPQDIRELLGRAAARFGLRRTVRVLQSTLVGGPAAIGYLRPIILLPVSAVTGLPANQLEAILAHELAHIRRHDYAVNFVQVLFETLFFYHPAVWWLSQRIRVERENCCDDFVVDSLDNRVAYSRALIAIAELPAAGTSLALGANDGTLSSRIARITGFRPTATAGSPWTTVCLTACCVAVIWGLATINGLAETNDDDLTFLVAEWSAVIDEGVLKEIRELHDDKRPLDSGGGLETLRCSAEELRAVLKRHFEDEGAIPGQSMRILPATPRSFFRSGITAFAMSDSIFLGRDTNPVATSSTGVGQAQINSTQAGPQLNLNLEFTFNVQDAKIRAPVKFDSLVPSGRTAVFILTPQGKADGRSLIVGFESFQAPTSQLPLFKKPMLASDWLRMGADGIKQRIARIVAWQDKATQKVADVDPAWTRDLKNGGHIQLIALSNPKRAPGIWWTPAGKPIVVDEPQPFTSSWENNTAVLVRIWETGKKRNVMPPGTTMFGGGATNLMDDCEAAPGSQLLIADVDLLYPDGKPHLDLGTGFGPWAGEAELSTDSGAVTVIDNVEFETKHIHGFAGTPQIAANFQWQGTDAWNFSAAAVTVDGNEVWPTSNPLVYTEKLRAPTESGQFWYHGLAEANLDHFVIKSRPCQWAEFAGFVAHLPKEVQQADPADLTTSEFGPESNGLQCRLIAVSPDADDEAPELAKPTTGFTSGDDVTFAVEIKNVSEQPIMLLGLRYGENYGDAEGKLNRVHFAPQLFEFQFADADGQPLPRTKREMVQVKNLLPGFSTHRLEPGESLSWLLRPAQFMSPLNFNLPRGQFRATVRYRRPEESLLARIKKKWPELPAAKSWPLEVESNTVKFSVAAAPVPPKPPQLVWGPATKGLQAAIEFETPQEVDDDPAAPPGVPVETRLGVAFHLKNVSDEPITFVSANARQDDQPRVTDAGGNGVPIRGTFITGLPHLIRWTLKPGESARLNVLVPALETIKNPGRYDVRYTLHLGNMRMQDGQGNVILPRPGDWQGQLETGNTPLFLRAKAPQDDAASTKSGAKVLEFRIAASAADADTEPRVPADFLKRDYPDYSGKQVAAAADQGFAWFPVADSLKGRGNALIEKAGDGQQRVALLADTRQHAMRWDGTWRVLECKVVKDENSPNGDAAVRVTLDKAGGAAFRRLTKAHVNQALALIVDGTIVAAPTIRSEIGASVLIAGDFSQAQAEQLATTIRRGIAGPIKDNEKPADAEEEAAPRPKTEVDEATSDLPNMRLIGDQVTAEAVEGLAGRDWGTVALWKAHFSGAIIERLRHAHSIRRLRLYGDGLSGHLARLKNVDGLVDLDIGAPLKVWDLIILTKTLPQLERLKLPSDLALTVTGAQQIGRLANLKSLDLAVVDVDDAAFAEFLPLVNLEELDLTHTRVTDVGLKVLERMPKLKSLRLYRPPDWYIPQQITDECLTTICQLQDLEKLSLSGEITDAGLAKIAALPKLKSLSILETKITYNGLAALENSSVEDLDLPVQLVDGFEHNGLQHLRSCRQLKQVTVHGQPRQPDFSDALQRAAPNISWSFQS